MTRPAPAERIRATPARAHRSAVLAVVVSAVATGVYAGVGALAVYPVGMATLLAATAAYVWAVVAAARARSPRGRSVLAATGAVLVVAVAFPPRTSTDVWAYAMYGRIVAVHGESPYLLPPAAFPDDVGLERMTAWHEQRTMYGPAFTLVSAAGAAVTSSRLGTRLFFQGLSALAAFAAALLVWRRTRDPGATAAIGLNPVLAGHVVGGAHNDALVGLGLLAAALLLTDRRGGWAGLAVGAAALVKVVAFLPMAALGWWVLRRRGARALVAYALPALALAGGAYAVVGVRASIDAFSFTSGLVRRFSVPGMIRALTDQPEAARAFSLGATAVAIAVGAALTVLLARRHGPATIVVVSLLPWTLLAAYLLPWYLAWTLPLVALAGPGARLWIATGAGSLLALAYFPYGYRPYPGPLGEVYDPIVRFVTPLALAALAVGLVAWAARARWGPDLG